MLNRYAFVCWLSLAASLGCSEGPAEQQGGAGSGSSAAGSGASAGRASTGGAAGVSGMSSGGAPNAGGAGGRASGGSSATGGAGAGNTGGRSATGGASGVSGAGAGLGGAGGIGGAGSGGMPGGAAGAAVGGTAGMAAAGTAGTAGGAGQTGAAGGPSLPPTTDYAADGPFDTTIDQNTGPNGMYTVFRPATLGENGFLHAPIVFGPGIGQQVSVHTTMLTKFASHGFVVVGCPVLSGGPGDAGNRMTMLNGLTWILAQNEMSSGLYAGKIYADHAVSMGFSVGGTSAVEIGGHRATAELHGTMLQTTGTQDTVGLPLQQQTYDSSEVPTFLATLTGAPHGYIESNGGGEQRPAIVAWMRYWIYGDTGATDYFFGDDCVLCQAPWEDPQRKNWP
jgi:hypothetical protein